MSSDYRPTEFEQRHYERWEQANYFAPSGTGAPYCIVIPPPNVTGTLHMGHAFGHAIKDALIRFHRMRGDDTLWQPGTDHAGIATQIVVERMLEAENTDRHALGREKFVERVWDWKHQSGGTIARQMRRLGDSVDWSRERFTMDPELSRVVTEVFVRLHDEGLIYRGHRLVNWDPTLHTAVSDLEVESAEESAKLWHFRYPLADRNEALVVATTRPETMLGDTAVAVHPDDSRYAHLIGETIRLPLAGRLIPIVADEHVDPEFGTGCVKITPAHDFNDYEIGQRHSLPMINIFDDDAALNENVPETYRGMDRFEARSRVVADLDALGLLEGIEDHTAMIPRCERSGAIVEPYLTDQWYVDTKPLAKAAIAAVESGDVRFVPENWSKTYFEWMHNIQDWCISRQLWWGHRIPAWYDHRGEIYVGRDEEEVRSKHAIPPDVVLAQDPDVLDTWFSSALWPFSTLGWPEETSELERFYPTNVLVTGFDIIFFWVARMIMMGLKFTGEVPFRQVYIHGLVRDHEGQKMSKSKGNTLDPLDLIEGIDLESLVAKRTEALMNPDQKPAIEKVTRAEFPDGIPAYGTDALRMTFASLATLARDVRFDLGRIDGYHRFCNKLWNASQYVFAQLGEAPDGDIELSVADRWIRAKLSECIANTTTAIESYRFDLATQSLYEFTWHEFCDWYLELTKPILTGDDVAPSLQQGAKATLAEVLGALLKLLHPIAPFVTEELWLALREKTGQSSETIMLEAYPRADDFAADAEALAEVEWLKSFIVGVRKIRGEMNLSPSRPLPVKLEGYTEEDRKQVATNGLYIERLARVESIDWLEPGEKAPGAATELLGDMRILIPLAGLIDADKEIERLGKQIAKLVTDLEKTNNKLSNERFTRNAPPEVVARERGRADELTQRRSRLEQQIEKLREIA
ncbi:MAG TPA: valine--tRNA ligase [Gammaproteobacteria bacterium]|jgi:valyl-tRNA synthetase